MYLTYYRIVKYLSKMINLPLLLSNFGSAGGQSEDVVKVTRDVGVKGSRQVPRLADPVVVQSPKKRNEH